VGVANRALECAGCACQTLVSSRGKSGEYMCVSEVSSAVRN
jgi:hypothetical protein